MYKAGFQYLEQRDEDNNITHIGIVSKKTPFANSNNTGIFDVIAENFRVLYDDFTLANVVKLKEDITAMYEDMKNNPNYGSTSATEQAKLAKQYADLAVAMYEHIKDDTNALLGIEQDMETTRDYLRKCLEYYQRIVTLDSSVAKTAEEVKTSAVNAKTSELNSKVSETNAKESENNAKLYAQQAGASEVNTEKFYKELTGKGLCTKKDAIKYALIF